MYGTIRVLLGLILFGSFVLTVRKNSFVRRPPLYITGALLSVASMLVLYFVPIENWFLTFRSPEAAYRYTAFGKTNIIHKIDGNESTFMIDRSEYADTHLIIPKSEDGWKIGLGSDTECVYWDSIDSKTITIYQYKNSDDYYLFVQTINTEKVEVKDSCNSEFFKLEAGGVYFSTYCTYLPKPEKQYWLSINDIQVMPFSK